MRLPFKSSNPILRNRRPFCTGINSLELCRDRADFLLDNVIALTLAVELPVPGRVRGKRAGSDNQEDRRNRDRVVIFEKVEKVLEHRFCIGAKPQLFDTSVP